MSFSLETLLLFLLMQSVVIAQTALPRGPDRSSRSGDSGALVSMLEYIPVASSVTVRGPELESPPTPPTPLATLVRLGTTAPTYCNLRALHSTTLTVTLDLGSDYDFGNRSFKVECALSIVGVDDLGAAQVTHTVPLEINNGVPERRYHVALTGTDLTTHDGVSEYQIFVSNFSASAPFKDSVRVILSYRDLFAVGERRIDSPAVAAVALNPLQFPVESRRPVPFQWLPAGWCPNDEFPSYQLQLLRLHNMSPAYQNDSFKVHAVVDWSQAVTYETRSSARSLPLMVAQGTGWYLWRVRPIGSRFPGGSGDSRNWGVWTDAPATGYVMDINVPYDSNPGPHRFFYRQFDDSLNWQFQRGMTEGEEGTRIAEGITFLSPLGLPRQTQSRSNSDKTPLLATQYVPDFSGRTSLQSMTAPAGGAGMPIGYRRRFFTQGPYQASPVYTAEHFDADTNYRDPWEAEGGPGAYFSASADSVSTAHGYPFSRSLYTGDGSGRIAEMGGPGSVYRIGEGEGGKSRTTTVRYGSASERELVRLFGDEAPTDSLVQKVLVTDGNKVTSVQYVAGGRTIATALEYAQGDTLLLPLSHASEPRLTQTISDTIRGDRPRSGGSSSLKRYAFAQPTTITIRYSLEPDTVSVRSNCVDECVTCDYRISIIVHDGERPESTQVYSYVRGAHPCDSVSIITDTIQLSLPAGTYVVERRLETGTVDPATRTADDPSGRTYADSLLSLAEQSMRSEIELDDSLAVIRGLLAANDLDSLYRYVGLDIDSLPIGESVTITTSCCTITFPVLDPDCGFNPCRDSVPSFEAYLYDRYPTYEGDINAFFRRDNEPLWPDEDRPPAPFDTLVKNMLADTNSTGQKLYDCGTLWGIWSGLVNGFETLRRDPDHMDDPEAFNPDFDLLDMFLQAAGVHLQDTARNPYHSTRSYLLHAHRFIPGPALEHADCRIASDFSTTWYAEPDSSHKWQELFACWKGATTDNSRLERPERLYDCDPLLPPDSCAVWRAQKIMEQCREVCESRRAEFAAAIQAAYSAQEDPLTWAEALCKAQAIVDSCRADCSLTIPSPPDTIGTPAEWEAIRRVYADMIEVAVPIIDGTDTTCANDSMSLSTGYEIAIEDYIAQYLNDELASHRQQHGGGGLWNGFMDAVRSTEIGTLEQQISDSTIWVPQNLSDSAWFEVRDGCELWYVADTLFPRTHLMVDKLNEYLDAVWGMSVDSADASTATEALPFLPGELRHYTPPSLVPDIVAELVALRATLVSWVNGNWSSQPIADFVDSVYPSIASSAIFFQGDPTGRHAVVGLQFTSDLEMLTSTNPISFSGSSRVVVSHKVDPVFGANDIFNFLVRGTSSESLTSTDPHRVGSIRDFDRMLDQPFTGRIGYFDIDDEGYLRYNARHFAPDSVGARFRITPVRFFVDPSRKVSDSICGVKRCPDICWRWIPRPADSSEADTIRPLNCEETAVIRITSAIDQSIDRCVDEAQFELRNLYNQKCGATDSLNETFSVEYPVDLIHFSLYYYDRAGRLVRTIPPKGVDVLGPTATRNNHPNHTYRSEYDYNSLGQLVRSSSPDGGEVTVWYDRHGRPRFTRDDRLVALGLYAFTKYDALGRVVAHGTSSQNVGGGAFAANVDDASYPSSTTEQTTLAYDDGTTIYYLDGTPQQYLRGRLRKTVSSDGVETHYSYDPHGNVVWSAQKLAGAYRTNYTKYEFDLISGNVNKVIYNEGRADQFIHRYTYDQDNRLVEVATSRDSVVWDSDARYTYFEHGPLRRIELGEDRVQGLDHTYTLTGQLKAINEKSLNVSNDPGKDGQSRSRVAADSFAIELQYNEGDFWSAFDEKYNSNSVDDLRGAPLYDGNIAGAEVHIGKTIGGKYEGRVGESYRYDQLGRLDNAWLHRYNGTTYDTASHEYRSSYEYDANGNITQLVRHAYDTLNSSSVLTSRMDSLVYGYANADDNQLDSIHEAVTGDPYAEDLAPYQGTGYYEYDEVGNLEAEGSTTMEWDSYGRIKTVTIGGSSAGTISFLYDAAGNRVKKSAQSAAPLAPTVNTYYVYDASSTVVAIYEEICAAETAKPPRPPLPSNVDADGDTWPDSVDCEPGVPNPDWEDGDGDGVPDQCDNCPCTANPNQDDSDGDGNGNWCDPDPMNPDGSGPDGDEDGDGIDNDADHCGCDPTNTCDQCPMQLVELPIYGLGRVGVAKPEGVVISDPSNQGPVYERPIGEKFYELSDHLGNVRMVIGDIKRSVLDNNDVPGEFFADVHSFMNAYPYGMPHPGRWWDSSLVLNTTTTYRYGYNGVETDPEIEGQPHAHFSTLFRQYDPRVARWWSNDPIVHSWESPYASMAGNPILLSDALGLQGESGSAKDGPGSTPEKSIPLGEVRVSSTPLPNWANLPIGSDSPMAEQLRHQWALNQQYLAAYTPYYEPAATIDVAPTNIVREVKEFLEEQNLILLRSGQSTPYAINSLALGALHFADQVHVVGHDIDYRLGFQPHPAEHLWGGIANSGELVEARFGVLASLYGSVLARGGLGRPNIMPTQTLKTSTPSTPLRAPVPRHFATRVKMNSPKKYENTVIEPGVDVLAELRAINAGRAVRIRDTWHINGHVYGVHNGALVPISGPGFHPLTRGAIEHWVFSIQTVIRRRRELYFGRRNYEQLMWRPGCVSTTLSVNCDDRYSVYTSDGCAGVRECSRARARHS